MRSKEIVVCTDDDELIADIPSLESEDQRVICKNGYKVIIAGEELEVEKIEPQDTLQSEVVEDGVICTDEIKLRGERLKVEWPEVNEDELVGYVLRAVAEQKDYHNLTYNEVRAVLDAELDFFIEKGIAHEE